jgi:hypothetical protein
MDDHVQHRTIAQASASRLPGDPDRRRPAVSLVGRAVVRTSPQRRRRKVVGSVIRPDVI